MKNYFSILLLIFIQTINSQTIDATRIEINFHGSSDPQSFTAFENGFYFTATDGTNVDFGRELYYSDGTANGTLRVKDINEGFNSSNPSSLVIVNNMLYFVANDGTHGAELWKSDGTETGTMLVKDIRPNDNSSYNEPSNLIGLNGVLFFTANDNISGYELWKSDGTESGTIMVKDINPNGNGSPNDLFVYNDNLYFTANNGTNGIELWKSDGTEAGTNMVKDFNSTYSGLNIGNEFLILNNFFYFFANNGTNGLELWKSDGTELGTSMVKDIRVGAGSSANILKGSLLNDMIIFEASDGANGMEVWKTDGTEEGTLMIKNIDNSFYDSVPYNSLYFTYNNEVYFLADDNIHGTEIWKTDGTESGTMLLKDINEGNLSVGINKFHWDQVNNKLLFFSNSTNSYDKTLWVSDGTSEGTIEISTIKDSNISNLIENFITINNSTIITGEDEIFGNELWVTDGTTAGTSFFTDLSYSYNSNPSKFTNVNGNLFFRAIGKEYGNELFKSDGSITGTEMVKEINPGNNSIDDPSEMKEINGILYFSAVDGIHGYELWRSDGTETGTYMVKDIHAGYPSSMQNYNYKQEFTAINDILYFNANDGIHGRELWRSDGTESGTFMIKDINTGGEFSQGSWADEFVLLNNEIYFIAKDDTGSGLWKTDGTESGTIKIINLNDMRILKVVNNKIIIFAETSDTSYGPHDLWVSDGTASGTSHLMSFGDGIDSNIQFTSILNNELYFIAKHPSNGLKSVYKTDGINVTLLFAAINHPDIDPSVIDIDVIQTCNNSVYFIVEDYVTSKELWRTNSTVTEKIAGSDTPNFYYIRNLTCYKNNLLYLAENPVHKIWATNDNINEGIQIDVNIINGPNLENYNSIEEMGATDNKLYFRARNEISGSELYVTEFDNSLLNNFEFENSENGQSQIVKLYPNPTKNYVKIESLSTANIIKFEILDLSGKSVFIQSNIYSNFVIYNTENLQKGIYYVKVILEDNSLDTIKLIVN